MGPSTSGPQGLRFPDEGAPNEDSHDFLKGRQQYFQLWMTTPLDSMLGSGRKEDRACLRSYPLNCLS